MFGEKVKTYYWYDTPDGEDILKKTSFAMKIGYLFGMPIGLYDMAMVAQPKMSLHLFRYTKIVLPFVGVGAMFTLTSQLLCKKFPELDPRISYAIGGASVGTVVQAAAKHKHIGGIVAFYGFIGCFLMRDFGVYGESMWGQQVKGDFPDNDWELFRFNMRQDPGLNLPPPNSRPAAGGSRLGL